MEAKETAGGMGSIFLHETLFFLVLDLMLHEESILEEEKISLSGL